MLGLRSTRCILFRAAGIANTTGPARDRVQDAQVAVVESEHDGVAARADFRGDRALVVSATDNWTLAPGRPTRDWMDATPARGAYRCLPLAIANQCGWIVTCPFTFCARWNGKPEATGLTMRFPEGEGPNTGQVRSQLRASDNPHTVTEARWSRCARSTANRSR